MACCPYTAESLSLGADQPVCSHLDLSFSRCTQTCNGEGREVEGPTAARRAAQSTLMLVYAYLQSKSFHFLSLHLRLFLKMLSFTLTATASFYYVLD